MRQKTRPVLRLNYNARIATVSCRLVRIDLVIHACIIPVMLGTV